MGTTIDNATVATMDEFSRVIKQGAVHIEDGEIVDVGSSSEVKSRNRTTDLHIDAKGMLLLPTFINAHTHTIHTLRRGIGSELDFTAWLRRVVWPISTIISPEDMRLAASISAVEAIKSGTSYLLDHLVVGISSESIRLVAGAYDEAGIKAGIAVGITQRTKRADLWNIPKERFPFALEEIVKIIRSAAVALAEKKRRGISVWPAPVTIFSSGPEAFRVAWELSEEYGSGFHTHIAETQSEVESTLEDYSWREVEFLNKVGVLGSRTSLAHCIWLDDREIELLAKTGTSVVHCPISNMYLGDGVARIPLMIEKGVNVALGSDGGTCGSAHDMFGVIKATALLHKVHNMNPKLVTALQILRMATMGGARSVGLESKIGSIEVGKSADMLILNLKKLYSAPVGDIFSNVVYYASPANVEYVMINGKLVVENQNLLTLDEQKLVDEAQRRADEIEFKVSKITQA